MNTNAVNVVRVSRVYERRRYKVHIVDGGIALCGGKMKGFHLQATFEEVSCKRCLKARARQSERANGLSLVKKNEAE